MGTKLQLHSSLVDVSLTCSTGQTVRCHKVLLAAASPYFQRLFSESGTKHPVVILPQVGLSELQDVVEYIYRGEISLNQSRLASFLSVSRSLQLNGLEKFIKEEVKEEKMEDVEEEEMDKGSDFAENDEAIPQDLSMKSQLQSPTSKRRRLDDSSLVLPGPTHDPQPEVGRGVLPSFPHHLLSSSLAHAIMLNAAPTTTQVIKAQLDQDKATDVKKGSKEAKDLKAEGSKVPPWSQSQLQEAIESVITQKLRFTQASAKYGIPKGTLYDNILGKSKRMLVLEQVGLTENQEMSVLEFCCEISSMPYNRRTSRSLRDIREFITMLKTKEGKADFTMSMRQGFKWWWAFTKKHSIISLYYESPEQDNLSRLERPAKRQSVSPPPRSPSSPSPGSTATPSSRRSTQTLLPRLSPIQTLPSCPARGRLQTLVLLQHKR